MDIDPADVSLPSLRSGVRRFDRNRFSMIVLKASSRSWFAVTLASQLMFAAYIALVYGFAAFGGQLGDRSRFLNHAYVPGDHAGNAAVLGHLVFGMLINASGALQLIPQLRARAPWFHRWNGRVFIFGAFIVASAGLYLVWIRGSGGIGDLWQHLASTLDALLIFSFALLALRYAMTRRLADHRRWALRLFMVLGGVWFFRLGLFLWIVVNRGPVGFDDNTFTGPVLTVLSFGEYLVPLAILELYLYAEGRVVTPAVRIATGALVFVATLMMFAGTFAVGMAAWLPSVEHSMKGG